MPQILILADDMTGANDTGCAIHELGIDVCSVNDLSLPAPLAENFQCLSVNLNSRSLPPKDAAQAVNQAATRFSSPDTILYSKRIDSTLRGNLGSECTALLDWLDNGASCIVVPSFPTAGRVYQNGIVSVHGIPLNQTAAAQDPEHPICTSSPAQIFQMQTDLSLRAIPLDTVRSPSSLLSQIKSCYEQHVRIILIEAVTLSDLDQIAEAVIKSEIAFVCVDPGPFTASVAKHLTFYQASSPPALPTPRGHKTLLVIGSVNAVTRQQASYRSAHRAMTPVLLDVEQLLAGLPALPEGESGRLAWLFSLLSEARYDPEGGPTAWDALVGDGADSEGLALTFQLLAEELEVGAALVEGTLDGQRHFWNQLTADGGAHYVDLTRDADGTTYSPQDLLALGYVWDGAPEI